jgi:hypothetical protein
LPNTNTQQKQQRHTLQKQTPTPNKQCGRCSRPLSRNQGTHTGDKPPRTPQPHRGQGIVRNQTGV